MVRISKSALAGLSALALGGAMSFSAASHAQLFETLGPAGSTPFGAGPPVGVSCPAGSRAIGLSTAGIPVFGGRRVAFVGLVCAPPGIPNPSPAQRVRSPLITGFAPGQMTGNPLVHGNLILPSPRDVMCPSNGTLVGVRVQSGDAVDAITGLTCRAPGAAGGGGLGSFIVNVGGTSGTPMLLNCALGNEVFALEGYAGDWLDQMAVLCRPTPVSAAPPPPPPTAPVQPAPIVPLDLELSVTLNVNPGSGPAQQLGEFDHSERVTGDITVRNVSTADWARFNRTSPAVDLRLFGPNDITQLAQSRTVAGAEGDVPPGGELTLPAQFNFNPTLQPGRYLLCAYADPANRIAETNENNNRECRDLRITSQPTVLTAELQVQGAPIIERDWHRLDEPIIFQYISGRNFGDATAVFGTAPVFNIEIRPPGYEYTPFVTSYALASASLTLPPGRNEIFAGGGQLVIQNNGQPELSFTEHAGLEPGSYTLCVVIDPQVVVPESDDMDNGLCRPINLIAGASTPGSNGVNGVNGYYAPPDQEAIRFTLVDAESQQDVQTLEPGGSIPFIWTGPWASVSIRAEPAPGTGLTFESVFFELSGIGANHTQLEQEPPFALFSNGEGGVYLGDNLPIIGDFLLRARAFAVDDPGPQNQPIADMTLRFERNSQDDRYDIELVD